TDRDHRHPYERKDLGQQRCHHRDDHYPQEGRHLPRPPLMVAGLKLPSQGHCPCLLFDRSANYSEVRHSTVMSRPRNWQPQFVLLLALMLWAAPAFSKKKQLPAVRWQPNAPGCEFQRGDDGRYRWRFVRDDLGMTLLWD